MLDLNINVNIYFKTFNNYILILFQIIIFYWKIKSNNYIQFIIKYNNL